MRRLASLLFLLALLPCSFAGEQIVGTFRPGLPQQAEVLAHVPVKGLVAEFINPQGTGLGKSLGYLLWREVLTAVQDQRGAGVIYAHTPSDTQLTDLLRRDYHRAAVEIAQAQHSRMALWGVATELGDQVYINSYLTLLPELIGDQLSVNLAVHGERQAGLAAEVGRSRYNFAMVRSTRAQLFDRALVTRREVQLRAAPDKQAATVRQVAKDTALHAVDMRDRWFEVALKDGGRAWVDIDSVEVPPREVHADRTGLNIRARPDGALLRKTNLHGDYRVLDMRYIPGSGLWYRLQFERDSGWVAGWLVEPRFSLPAVYFMAGLQRYQLKNYMEARKAFQAFITMAGDSESNVNLAGAYAMLGGAILMQRFHSAGEAAPALQAIEHAVALTPYDPAMYNLSAVTRLVVESRVGGTLDDLGAALKLDASNPRALAILDSVAEVAKGRGGRYAELGYSLRLDAQDRTRIDSLQQRFLK
jgi:tetratricopeptide (TPR) repeat protein